MPSPAREHVTPSQDSQPRAKAVPLGAPQAFSEESADLFRRMVAADGLTHAALIEILGVTQFVVSDALVNGKVSARLLLRLAAVRPACRRAMVQYLQDLYDEAPLSTITVDRHALTLARATGRASDTVLRALADGKIDKGEAREMEGAFGEVAKVALRAVGDCRKAVAR